MERRDFVRRSGITVALLTGCLGGGEEPEGEEGNNETTDGGGGEDTGNRTESGEDGETGEENGEQDEDTEGEARGYTRFMYDPEQVAVEVEGYFFTYTGTGASQEMSERFQTADTGRTARIEVTRAETGSDGGAPPEQAEVDIVSIRVYEEGGSFGELGTALTEPVDSYAGYDIYESGGSALGVNEDELTVVEGSSTEQVRLVAGTLAGDTSSYAESDDNMGVLTDAVGTGDAVLVRGGLIEVDVPEIEDAVATAVSLSEEDETVSLRYAVVYPDEEGASAVVSTESLEDGGGDLTPMLALAVTELNLAPEDVEVSEQTTEGRVAVLEASVERSVFFGGL